MSRLFLGLDASTQSLTALLIDLDRGAVVHRAALLYDRDLAGYGTVHGVLPNPDPTVRHAPPLMWVEALDRLLAGMKAEGAPLERVLAVSGSGQQHGSVYLAAGWSDRLAGLDPGHPLASQLADLFTRPSAPIWMDSSSAAECAEIAAAMAGGAAQVARLSGSPPAERFTGPQIRAFWKRQPQAYRRTGRIHLVSSFMASLLGGGDAPIDPGDGAGMNLMELAHASWHSGLLAATAPGLRDKLPALASSWTVTGPVAAYWNRRHGLAADALNVVWSGDNPCSLVGMGLVETGQAGISLGTSDTCFATLAQPRLPPSGAGHVFGHPAGGWMGLVCFRNGSLARERVRDMFGLDWAGFARILAESPPGNRGGLLLPWFEPETVPRVVAPGLRRRGIAPGDVAAHVRGVVEAQMLAMRRHAAWPGAAPACIRVTGGGAQNDALLQVLADVHGCEVQRSAGGDGAALGAALRAAHAWLRRRGAAAWPDLVAPFTRPQPPLFRPAPGSAAIYERLLADYGDFETESLAGLSPG